MILALLLAVESVVVVSMPPISGTVALKGNVTIGATIDSNLITIKGKTVLTAADGVQYIALYGSYSFGRTWTLLDSTDSVKATQNGAWTVGRTWSLAYAGDSVTTYQGTSPWVTSRNWVLGATDLPGLPSGTSPAQSQTLIGTTSTAITVPASARSCEIANVGASTCYYNPAGASTTSSRPVGGTSIFAPTWTLDCTGAACTGLTGICPSGAQLSGAATVLTCLN